MFKLIRLTLLFASMITSGRPALASSLGRRAISQDLLTEFTRFTNYSSGAYQPSCPHPLGNTLVTAFNNAQTNTQGFIARDDARKEIVVAFRGSRQIEDFIRDLNFTRVPLASPGVSNTNNATVNAGFQQSYNSVASTILSTVTSQLQQFPDYTLISTGHSLGGCLASIGSVSLASNFPGTPLRLFTFGQPRTGDAAYASTVEALIGAGNIYRTVHTIDGVPNLIPQAFGYRHHATEYWNYIDPSIPANVKQCTGQEDPTCSDSIPFTALNPAHFYYFGQVIDVGPEPQVCQ